MKLTQINIQNFIGAHAVELQIQKPICLISGKNYAGKSSVMDAVRMALTGEAARINLKKEYGALVSDGQDSGFAEVTGTEDGQDFTASIVLPSGKGKHRPETALPYVLEAQRFAILGVNERRAFLFGVMGIKTGGSEVKEKLLKRGCDPDNVELVLPMLRVGST
ncbi:MAG: AAA family ATPase [Burkholderiales bacterium]